MQAIILAAGMGKRLGRLTRNNTKCMVEVNGVKLIDRLLSQLGTVGVSRVVIVTGYQGQNLRDYVGQEYNGLPVVYVENPIYDKTNNIYSLYLAKDYLQEDDTVLVESDLIFDDSIIQKIVSDPYPDLAFVAKYESWMDGTMVRIDQDNNIVDFVTKEAFVYEDVPFYYKTLNIYKFSKGFSATEYVPFLEAYSKMMGNNEYYEQVLRVIVSLKNSTLKALPVSSEKWYEIDDVQDLDIASTIFSAGVKKYHEYHKRYGGFWRFPKLLDFCYLVNPYFPTKPMRDEMRASFDTLLSSYPSGMFINSMLAGKYFSVSQDKIVVGNGAAELIKTLSDTFGNKKIGVIFPSFDEYPNRLDDSQIVPFVPEKEGFTYTVDELTDFYSSKGISVLLLINPDNPSGNLLSFNDVTKLSGWCMGRGVQLVLDESFADFANDGDATPMKSFLDDALLEEYPNLVVIKSISKSYGVPGLRLGVLASADTDLIKGLKSEVPIWNINSFAEYYMQIFGKYEKEYRKACVKFKAEREKFYKELSEIPFLKVFPSQANYFLCEVTSKYSSAELTQKLIGNDVLISDCSRKRLMHGRNIIRLAIRNRKDNSRLVEILKSM